MLFRYQARLSLLFALIATAAAAAAGQEFSEIRPGVEYARMSRVIGGKNVNFNLLRLDLKKVRLDVVHAMDSAIGTETTSSLAVRHNAVAAVNAGFFRLDNSLWAGDAAGVLKIDGELLSESVQDRTALLIINSKTQTAVSFGPLRVGVGFRDGSSVPIAGINRERKSDEAVKYTPEFNTTTLTDNSGVEIVVRNGKVTAIFDGKGSTEIPCDGSVISATGSARAKLLANTKVGDKIKMTTVFPAGSKDARIDRISDAFSAAEDVTNGVPRLIRDGKIDITWKQEGASKAFVETRHPRTAVANLKDGRFLMLTADGRSEASAGIDLYDLADLLLELGAVDALNLDGGGSTTMYLDGKVVNSPSDKNGERKIGDALIVTVRR
ncbi:MAG: phosphodiester glycosidase family protein [Acidobacteria bacterium]|nr:phosphodiester glycosidase family protein [Acidobacteriota bacterium]